MNGRGILIVSGVTPAAVQRGGVRAHLLGLRHAPRHRRRAKRQRRPPGLRAEQPEDDQVKRGYRSLRELHMHTDSYEVVGLMCVRKAKSGGLSGLAPQPRRSTTRSCARGPSCWRRCTAAFASPARRRASRARRSPTKRCRCSPTSTASCRCMYEPSHMKNAAEMPGGMPDDLDGGARLLRRDRQPRGHGAALPARARRHDAVAQLHEPALAHGVRGRSRVAAAAACGCGSACRTAGPPIRRSGCAPKPTSASIASGSRRATS